MKVRALIGFGGAFSMYKGEVKECNNNDTLQDLLKAGYVEEVKELEKVTEAFIKSKIEELSKLKEDVAQTENTNKKLESSSEDLENSKGNEKVGSLKKAKNKGKETE